MKKIIYEDLKELVVSECEEMHVRLRPICVNDTKNIVCWRNSDFVRSEFIIREPITIEMHNHWLENMVYKGLVIQYIIEINDIPVGTVYIRNIDIDNESGEFGIFIGEKDYTSKGIGTKVTQCILAYCFGLGFHRIFLRVLSKNMAAIKSYQKSGFEKEGVARDMVCIDGDRYDVVFMSIIND